MKKTSLFELAKKRKWKIFKFEHSEGVEIIVANHANEAINFYFNHYNDDLSVGGMVLSGGIKIIEVTGSELSRKHRIFNKKINSRELVSYEELAEKYFQGKPTVIVAPGYM